MGKPRLLSGSTEILHTVERGCQREGEERERERGERCKLYDRPLLQIDLPDCHPLLDAVGPAEDNF